MNESLASCPVIIEIPVAWGEMDALRHVNNIAYFRYFESARIAYFERLGLWEFMDHTFKGSNYGAPAIMFVRLHGARKGRLE
jgi:acyl-CoA thioester hydrolase